MLLKNKYKQYRNKLIEIISKVKYSYFGEKIKKIKITLKKFDLLWNRWLYTIHQHFWNQFNNITYEYESDPKLITNKFNKHFLVMGNHNDNRHTNQINYTSHNISVSLDV